MSKQKEAVKGPLPGRRLLLPRGVRRWPSPVLATLQRWGPRRLEVPAPRRCGLDAPSGPGFEPGLHQRPCGVHRRLCTPTNPGSSASMEGAVGRPEGHFPRGGAPARDRKARAKPRWWRWGSATQARRVSRALPAPAACAAGGGALGACAGLAASTAWGKRCGCCSHTWKRRECRAR